MEDLVFGRRYRATEKIGTGGMADVYMAVDDVLGRTVAIKVLHAHYATDPGFVARFRQEAQAAANLSHPNIVNIYDWGKDDDTYYIVMEYVRGTDLKALVQQKGPLDPYKAAEYCAQACGALSVAHGYDIIHRDIKPQNIVLTPDGAIKVMDFGIARAGNTTMTQTGSVLGTAHYVSPEQAQGRTLGPASDLYSLGVVLYELVTGELPFNGDTPVSVALKQVNEEAVPPRQIDPDLPPSIEAVIVRAMQKNPQDRYASAEEMRRDLTRVASGRMVESPMASMGSKADETSVMPVIDAGSNSRLRPTPRKKNPWPWIALVIGLLLVGLGAAAAFGLFDTTPKVVVPEVVGMTEAEATDALTAIELVVGTVDRTYGEEPSGTVISQTPGPNVELEVGGEVKLVVSKGRELVGMPDFAGMTEADALQAVRKAGFELDTIQRVYNKDVPDGQVFKQEPSAGANVPNGTLVTIYVSKGTQLVKVPDVLDQKQGEAKTNLEKAGFSVKVVDEASDVVKTGLVIRQTPDGGVSIEAGSQVTIVVSTGSKKAPVPDVIGKTESEAKATLTAAGFEPLVNYQTSPDDGIVLTQDPFAPFEAKFGSTVTIWVGKTPAP
ncbi:MAG: Stk1 family PASTA domain-containing Ser/Thr kinase [Actinomycetota bacterium]|nr:Stk1 family PASTA domain-containing Ser/Thr kinase [Actinomycetota bacterium]